MFEAYITNTALYPLMGIEVGTTVHFPMTTQELQAALAKIGIDGKRYSEVFFTSFDSDVLGLYDHLYECENIDELNELGHALLEVRDKGGLETFEAALVLGNHTRSVKDLINYHGPQDIPLEHRIFAYPEKAEPAHSILAALKRFQEAPACLKKDKAGLPMKNSRTSGQHGPKHEGGAYHQLLPYQ